MRKKLLSLSLTLPGVRLLRRWKKRQSGKMKKGKLLT